MMARAKKNSPNSGDAATRAKLLAVAGPVFAESGYYAATVREICKRAGANVAAINYHFGDKLGLYTEVLRQSLACAKEQAMQALSEPAPPEEALRKLIHSRVQAICSGDRPNWHIRIMAHELAQPTPAMPRVINETMRPTYARLRELIGGMLGLPPEDEKTRLAAHSIIGQVVHYAHARPILARLWPELKMTPAQIERIADHITEFSLAYIDAARSGRLTTASARHSRRSK